MKKLPKLSESDIEKLSKARDLIDYVQSRHRSNGYIIDVDKFLREKK